MKETGENTEKMAGESAIAASFVAYYLDGEASSIRSRSVSNRVVSGVIDLPTLPARLVSDWQRDLVTQLPLAPGEVGSLSLPRARSRWPTYRNSVQAVSDWLRRHGLDGDLTCAEVALMACRGAHYHHDAALYGGSVFCNLFVSEDRGQDVHFPIANVRIPLRPGTVLLFDTAQPHAVIKRSADAFDAADFTDYPAAAPIFLTWELPLGHGGVLSALGIQTDVEPATAQQLETPQLRWDGVVVEICQKSGRWRRTVPL